MVVCGLLAEVSVLASLFNPTAILMLPPLLRVPSLAERLSHDRVGDTIADQSTWKPDVLASVYVLPAGENEPPCGPLVMKPDVGVTSTLPEESIVSTTSTVVATPSLVVSLMRTVS